MHLLEWLKLKSLTSSYICNDLEELGVSYKHAAKQFVSHKNRHRASTTTNHTLDFEHESKKEYNKRKTIYVQVCQRKVLHDESFR